MAMLRHWASRREFARGCVGPSGVCAHARHTGRPDVQAPFVPPPPRGLRKEGIPREHALENQMSPNRTASALRTEHASKLRQERRGCVLHHATRHRGIAGHSRLANTADRGQVHMRGFQYGTCRFLRESFTHLTTVRCSCRQRVLLVGAPLRMLVDNFSGRARAPPPSHRKPSAPCTGVLHDEERVRSEVRSEPAHRAAWARLTGLMCRRGNNREGTGEEPRRDAPCECCRTNGTPPPKACHSDEVVATRRATGFPRAELLLLLGS